MAYHQKGFIEFLQDEADRSWMVYARCRNINTELADLLFFHPASGKDPYAGSRREFCSGCPVQNQCFVYGQIVAPKDGAWGGYSEKERRQIRRGWQRGKKATRAKDSEQRESETV